MLFVLPAERLTLWKITSTKLDQKKNINGDTVLNKNIVLGRFLANMLLYNQCLVLVATSLVCLPMGDAREASNVTGAGGSRTDRENLTRKEGSRNALCQSGAGVPMKTVLEPPNA